MKNELGLWRCKSTTPDMWCAAKIPPGIQKCCQEHAEWWLPFKFLALAQYALHLIPALTG